MRPKEPRRRVHRRVCPVHLEMVRKTGELLEKMIVDFQYSFQNELVGRDDAGSCPRELFECDKKFVEDILAEKDVFDNQYHAFWSGGDGESFFDNRDPANCYSAGGVPGKESSLLPSLKPFSRAPMLRRPRPALLLDEQEQKHLLRHSRWQLWKRQTIWLLLPSRNLLKLLQVK